MSQTLSGSGIWVKCKGIGIADAIIAKGGKEVKALKFGHFLHNLGIALCQMGRPLTFLKRSLKIRLAIHGELQHPDTAASYGSLGNVYHAQGDYPRAIEFHERSLKIELAIHGEHHPNTAKLYNNLGNVYHAQGDYPRAIEFYERSLKIFLAIHGEQHPDTSSSILTWAMFIIPRGTTHAP